MKRWFACFVGLALILSACSSAPTNKPSISIQKKVQFTLQDIWKISNPTDNTIYYYYLAKIDNQSKSEFSTKSIQYEFKDIKKHRLNEIDKAIITPSTIIPAKGSTYMYGYVGFPNNDQGEVGLQFKKPKKFLSFNNKNLREIEATALKSKNKDHFTALKSKELTIKVDARHTKTTFENGNTVLSNFEITYTNHTKRAIVIPYIEPQATLNGIQLNQYQSKADFTSMDIDQLKKIDFTENGLAPKTKDIKGIASGYIIYYLQPKQSLKLSIGFTFEKTAIDFTDEDHDVFDISLASMPFGTTSIITLSYDG